MFKYNVDTVYIKRNLYNWYIKKYLSVWFKSRFIFVINFLLFYLKAFKPINSQLQNKSIYDTH